MLTTYIACYIFPFYTMPRYNWNIAKVGVKHQSINPFCISTG
jgi:hypothetical protein